MSNIFKRALLAGAATTVVLAATAQAQDASPASATAPAAQEGVGDIVVTAQRREENLQSVPVSVGVVGGDDLRNFTSGGDDTLLALAGPSGIGVPADSSIIVDVDERARVASLQRVLDDQHRHGARLGAAPALRRALEALGYEQTLSQLPSGEARIRDVKQGVDGALYAASDEGYLYRVGLKPKSP